MYADMLLCFSLLLSQDELRKETPSFLLLRCGEGPYSDYRLHAPTAPHSRALRKGGRLGAQKSKSTVSNRLNFFASPPVAASFSSSSSNISASSSTMAIFW